MALYFVGDLQGCFAELQQLLAEVSFNPSQDTLFCAGDLVARGPDSLAVAQWVLANRHCVRTVLGNHDLHLMAVAHGLKKSKSKDKLQPLLEHECLPEYLDWLYRQPLACWQKNDYFIAHAGLYPGWQESQAIALANEVEQQLAKPKQRKLLLQHMYANQPQRWSAKLVEYERYRFIINAFTRMRYCDRHLNLDMDCKAPPKQAPANLQPWFSLSKPQQPVIFGHWAALMGDAHKPFYALDTGCVWGGQMTLLNWQTKHRTQVSSLEAKPSHW